MYNRDPRTCDVVETNCQAPPALFTSTRGTCYRCGNPVCLNCSKRIVYLRFGRRRICNNCVEEMKR